MMTAPNFMFEPITPYRTWFERFQEWRRTSNTNAEKLRDARQKSLDAAQAHRSAISRRDCTAPSTHKALVECTTEELRAENKCHHP